MSTRVTLIHIGDIHGHLIGRMHMRADEGQGRHLGGLARMYTRIAEIRARSENSLLINTGIASRLSAGSVSALTYADRLMEFPTAMLGVALGTVLLPSLSKANSSGDTAEYSALLNWGLRLTFLLALPAAVGLATLAEPMIATLFHYGKFTTAAITTSAMPLVAYSVGLLGIILVKTLAPAFYARQDVRTPVRIAVGVLVFTQLMNLVFVPISATGIPSRPSAAMADAAASGCAVASSVPSGSRRLPCRCAVALPMRMTSPRAITRAIGVGRR